MTIGAGASTDTSSAAAGGPYAAPHTAPPAFVIEKYVPLPPIDPRTGKSGRSTNRQGLPWHLLCVGDSVVVPDVIAVRGARIWMATNGRAVTTRKVRGGIRVWRTL